MIRSRSAVLTGAWLVGLALPLAGGCASDGDGTFVPGQTLYEGFGTYERETSTRSSEAQAWVNQGMKLLYGFNHDEAIRSFEGRRARKTPATPRCPTGASPTRTASTSTTR